MHLMLRLLDLDISYIQSNNIVVKKVIRINSDLDLESVQKNQFVPLVRINSSKIADTASQLGWKRVKPYRDLYKRMGLVQLLDSDNMQTF